MQDPPTPSHSPAQQIASSPVGELLTPLPADRALAAAKTRTSKATCDSEAMMEWAQSRCRSPYTYRNYLKEGRRFLAWCQSHGKHFCEVMTMDIKAYEAFLRNPSPDAIQQTSARKPLPLGHPAYRPFMGKLCDQSVDLSLTCISAMYSYLMQVGYLGNSPVAGKQRNAPDPNATSVKVKRFLDDELVSIVEEVLISPEYFPAGTEFKRKYNARIRFIFYLLVRTGLRCAEAARAMTSGIEITHHEGRERVFLTVVGKGNRVRTLPLTERIVEELKMYRMTFNRTPIPRPFEPAEPLIIRLRKPKRKPGTREAMEMESGLKDSAPVFDPMLPQEIYRAIDSLMGKVMQHLRDRNDVREAYFREVSTHWLRHTYGSALGRKAVELRKIADLLGHANIDTARIYVHSDLDHLYDEVSRALDD